MPERARKAPIRGSVWTWIILGGEAVLVLMVAAWFLGRDDDRQSDGPQAEQDAAVTSPAAAGQAPDAANPEAQTPAADDRSEAVPPAMPVFAPPAFDLVRVTPEGNALVSGRAGAGSVVAVLVEGREAARAKADAAGDFAVLFDLGQSDDPRRISLEMLGADGRRTASEATVILAPNRSVSTATGPAGGPEDAAEGPRPSQSGAPSSAIIGPPPADAAAILISDAGGVRLLEPPNSHEAPPVSGLTLDAISYDAQGAVRLAGRGRPGAALRIYIDNAPLSETGIDGAGRWTLRAPGIAAGRHVR
ncbi:Ig-like domain-containing protein, partial [Rhodovulum sulfidophilum]